jgi:hypothetical protein
MLRPFPETPENCRGEAFGQTISELSLKISAPNASPFPQNWVIAYSINQGEALGQKLWFFPMKYLPNASPLQFPDLGGG